MNQIEKIIDIATWNRREHYEHFSAFDDPFFGVTVNVDCTRAYQEAKDKGVSFSLLVLHRIVTAAAAVEEFRYRIEAALPTSFGPPWLTPDWLAGVGPLDSADGPTFAGSLLANAGLDLLTFNPNQAAVFRVVRVTD